MSTRITNGLVSYVSYLSKSFCPFDLAVWYPHPVYKVPIWQPIAALAVLAAITAVVLVRRRKNPYLLVGWLWYLGMLVPVIGLVQVSQHAMADRYMHLPQIGLSIAATWGFLFLVRSWPNRVWLCGAVASILIVGFMAISFEQTSYWRDSETLWTHTLECTSENKIARLNYGSFLFDQGRLEEAVDQYAEAVRIAPDYMKAQSNLGTALARLGRMDEAMTHFRMALMIEPESIKLRFNIVVALAQQGRIDEAIEQLDRTILLAKSQQDLLQVETMTAYRKQLLESRTPKQNKARTTATGGN